jgi:hypothetical protein
MNAPNPPAPEQLHRRPILIGVPVAWPPDVEPTEDPGDEPTEDPVVVLVEAFLLLEEQAPRAAAINTTHTADTNLRFAPTRSFPPARLQ